MREASAGDGLKSDSPIVVELFGQPGAGKSTLAHSAVTASNSVSRSSLGAAWKRQSKLVKSVFLARTLLDARCLGHAVKFAIGTRLFRGDSLPRLFRLLIKSQWLRSQTGPFLLSEGHLQDLWSILYSAQRITPDPPQIAPLIRCLFRGMDVQIVHLELDPESAFDRIRGRRNGKSRLDRFTDEELREHLILHELLPSRLAEAAILAGLRVERLDASLPIETNVGHLKSVMQNMSPSGRHG